MTRIVACFVMLVNAAPAFGATADGAAESFMDDSAENWWKVGIGVQTAFDANSDAACHAGKCQANGDAEKQLHMLQFGAEVKKKIVDSDIAENAQSASLPEVMESHQQDVSKPGRRNSTWSWLCRWASAPCNWLATMRARVAEQTMFVNQGAYTRGLQLSSNLSPSDGGIGRVVIGFVGLLLASCMVCMWFWGSSGRGGQGRFQQGQDRAWNTQGAQSLLRSFPAMPSNPKSDLSGKSAPAGRSAVVPPPEKPLDLLPSIYPKLVLPHANTRLAVPIEPLSDPQFDIDVLGLSGAPLLCASLTPSNAISISLHNVNTLLATVSAIQGAIEIRGSGDVLFGTLFTDKLQHVLKDASGRPVMAIRDISSDQSDLQFTTLNTGTPEVFAVCKRCPAEDKLPAEHYSLAAKPGVDCVLVLACMLGAVVFELSRYRSILGLASSASASG